MGRRLKRARLADDEAPVTAVVESLDSRGRGVVRGPGKVAFVDGALPGETVSYRRTRAHRRHDDAVVVEVLDPSPDRVVPRCAHFGTCGGCSLQHLDHRAQVALKQAGLLEALERGAGGMRPDAVLAPIAAEPWGYRRKARLTVKHVPGKGGVLVGFRERSSNYVALMESCDVLDPAIGLRVRALRDLLGGLEARARIPQIEVAVGDEAAVLVVRHLGALVASDRAALEGFAREHGVRLMLQPGGPGSVEPLAPRRVDPLGYALADFDLTLSFEPTDFVQVNAEVNRRLVRAAVDLLAPAPGARILDLFCGLGNFSLAIARRAGEVTGLELGAEMVARATDNARRNGIANATFLQADLDRPEVAADWLARGFDGVLIDPPRTGAASVVASLRPPYPARIAYVSCNPATLVRDAATLAGEHGYRLSHAGVVDMFPHTSHVECLCIFARA